jgi:uncharacterized membrane protein
MPNPAPTRAATPTPTPRADAPRRIVALAFDSTAKAHEALQSALRLQEHDLLTLHDAVFVCRAEDGTTQITETADPTPVAAAVPSSLFGALVGTLVAGPLGFLVGGVLAGGGGALAAKLIDTGIPTRIVSELQELTRPGQTVLALLVSDIAGMAVIEELRRFRGALVVYAQLPPASIQLVRQVLATDRPS